MNDPTVIVFRVGENSGGIKPGTYCVWIYATGRGELMYKEADWHSFGPAAEGTVEQ